MIKMPNPNIDVKDEVMVGEGGGDGEGNRGKNGRKGRKKKKGVKDLVMRGEGERAKKRVNM